jgi:hypothetical protein
MQATRVSYVKKREIGVGYVQTQTMPNNTTQEKVHHAAKLVEITLLEDLFTIDSNGSKLSVRHNYVRTPYM